MGNTLIKTRYTIRMPSPDSAVMRSEVSVEGGPMTLLMELVRGHPREKKPEWFQFMNAAR